MFGAFVSYQACLFKTIQHCLITDLLIKSCILSYLKIQIFDKQLNRVVILDRKQYRKFEL